MSWRSRMGCWRDGDRRESPGSPRLGIDLLESLLHRHAIGRDLASAADEGGELISDDGFVAWMGVVLDRFDGEQCGERVDLGDVRDGLGLETELDEAASQREHEQQLNVGGGLPPSLLAHEIEIAVVQFAPRFRVGVRVTHVVALCCDPEIHVPGGVPRGTVSAIPIPVPTRRGDSGTSRTPRRIGRKTVRGRSGRPWWTHSRNRCETGRGAAKCSSARAAHSAPGNRTGTGRAAGDVRASSPLSSALAHPPKVERARAGDAEAAVTTLAHREWSGSSARLWPWTRVPAARHPGFHESRSG